MRRCDEITQALHRSWFVAPDNIPVSAFGGKVKLTGTVQSCHEQQLAVQTAWSASGTTNVENDLAVV